MKTFCTVVLIVSALATMPALADRPFGSSNQGPPGAALTH
jgi:hypothetical protein